MIRFNNDYNRGAHPNIMKALMHFNTKSYSGYGTDEWCAAATERIRAMIGMADADVWFFPGATQANSVMISAATNSTQSVIAPDTGHINVHEGGAIEKAGRKILTVPNSDGKLSAEQVREIAAEYCESGEQEFYTEPKMVYISFPTENGTLYSLSELEAISAVCREYGMYLFVDGARLGYGLAAPANDVTLHDLARLTDAFYFGGTKCGAMMGEALVLPNKLFGNRFKAYMKQNGAVLAKGWLLGLQFYVLLRDNTYFDICGRADRQALRIRAAFESAGYKLAADSPTNQQFVVLNDEQRAEFAEKYYFEDCGPAEGGRSCRFATSWATTDDEVDALIADIARFGTHA